MTTSITLTNYLSNLEVNKEMKIYIFIQSVFVCHQHLEPINIFIVTPKKHFVISPIRRDKSGKFNYYLHNSKESVNNEPRRAMKNGIDSKSEPQRIMGQVRFKVATVIDANFSKLVRMMSKEARLRISTNHHFRKVMPHKLPVNREK
uniref:Uncharacterized protein n=1 Tax=Glossina pallidipes TaxID=7398 RepID=A0A1A9ZAZ1_GLOPL